MNTLRNIRSLIPSLLIVELAIATFAITTSAQVLVRPKIEKKPFVISMPNLGIVDLGEGKTPTSVYVQVSNVGSVDSGPFYIRLSLREKGSTTKTYVEHRVDGVKAKTDIPLFLEVGRRVAGLTIGIFVDSRRQVKELDETNCGTIYPDGGISGFEKCDNF